MEFEDVAENYHALCAFTSEILTKCSGWLPEVPEEWWQALDEFEEFDTTLKEEYR